MADFNENSQKGSTLMQQALKKYAEGDFEGGDKDRELANKFFDMASAEINSEEGKITQLYGESRNFGIVYNVIEQNMDGLLGTKKGKKFIQEAYNLIKRNEILNEQFKIYDFFEKASNKENAKEIVNESLSVIHRFKKNQIKENNEKLIKLIKKYKLNEFVDIPEEIENLYEAIEYVILNDKNFANINRFVDATNIIAEHIKRNGLNKIEESENTFEDFKSKVEEQENEIENSINEDERKFLDAFTNPKTNKRQLFEDMKIETLERIKNAINTSDEEEKTSWESIYESINSKTYSDKLSENIINCAEMIDICNTIDE